MCGIFKTPFNDFFELCLGKKHEIKIEGFEIGDAGKRMELIKEVSLRAFVPHPKSYLEKVVTIIDVNLRQP